MQRTHIAILRNPYFRLVLKGIKTIESRFSIYQIVPYKQVEVNDIILLKLSGGLIEGVTTVAKTQFYSDLTYEKIIEINQTYKAQLQIKEKYLELKQRSKYGSLIWLNDISPIIPIPYKQKGQKPWIILREEEIPSYQILEK